MIEYISLVCITTHQNNNIRNINKAKNELFTLKYKKKCSPKSGTKRVKNIQTHIFNYEQKSRLNREIRSFY